MSWVPSRKWAVTQVTAAAALAVAWVQSDGWSDTLTIMGIGVLSQALISYLVPNSSSDPEPVPNLAPPEPEPEPVEQLPFPQPVDNPPAPILMKPQE